MQETQIWKGSPSQITNIFLFATCGILDFLIIGAFYALWKRDQLGIQLNFSIDDRMLPYLCLIFLSLPTLFAFYKWLIQKFIKDEVTTQRVRRRLGFFSIREDDLELYRVKDITVVQPFLHRLFSVGSIHLATSDRSTPDFVLDAVPKVRELREQIRKSVETYRDEKGVKELELDTH